MRVVLEKRDRADRSDTSDLFLEAHFLYAIDRSLEQQIKKQLNTVGDLSSRNREKGEATNVHH
jgi:hypothetical protein